MIKQKLLSLLLTGVIMIQPLGFEQEVVTDYKSQESEDFLWQVLSENAPNEYIAAGILGYFWRESFYRSDSVTGWGSLKGAIGEDPCFKFTAELESMDKEMFIGTIRRAGGYGLGQWYSEKHLEEFYDFWKEHETGVADARMQCLFTIHGCINNADIWEQLKDADSAFLAGKIIGYLYDGSAVGAETIAAKADQIYKERCKK